MNYKKIAPFAVTLIVGYVFGSWLGLPFSSSGKDKAQQARPPMNRMRDPRKPPEPIDTSVTGVFNHFGTMPGAVKV